MSRLLEEASHLADKVPIHLHINGSEYDLVVEPRQTLLEVLREELHLFGTKEGCGNGNCGACSVLVDGRASNSCLIFAVQADGKEVRTVEGLATGMELHPLQQVFLEEAALQCGICTPGFLIAAASLLAHNPRPTEAEVRHHLAGNLCRCTGYDKIVRAVLRAAGQMQAQESVKEEVSA